MPLWAVHISDGFLAEAWVAGGFAVAGLLALFGAWRIRDEEVPRTAVMTAAFFVASLIHVKVWPTSVHLLFNGLMGVSLGRRAALAIPVGLFLQWALIGHGGLFSLGVNACVLVLPALAAGYLFALLRRLPWRSSRAAAALAHAATAAWVLGVVYLVTLLWTNRFGTTTLLDTGWANRVTLHPATLAAAAGLAALSAWAGRKLEHAAEFPLGLLVGGSAVLLTAALNALVLLWGVGEDWHTVALVTFVAHLPLAVVEGVVLGHTVSFLARVKPELLRAGAAEEVPCAAESLP